MNRFSAFAWRMHYELKPFNNYIEMWIGRIVTFAFFFFMVYGYHSVRCLINSECTYASSDFARIIFTFLYGS